MKIPFDDAYFMRRALQEAEVARDKGEVPVGAVVVVQDRIIARAHNMTEKLHDVTAHAEMQAINLKRSEVCPQWNYTILPLGSSG